MLIRLESGVIININHIVRIYRMGLNSDGDIIISFVNGEEEDEVTDSDIKSIVGAEVPVEIIGNIHDGGEK